MTKAEAEKIVAKLSAMICDAHVHVGWYNYRGSSVLKYYSPRRVNGVLNRCGVDEWIVSSTSAQAAGITNEGLLSEAREVKRLAGNRAHVFCWLTWDLYRRDPSLSVLNGGMYEGIKLHEMEGHWIEWHKAELECVLNRAEEIGIPVQFHSGVDDFCRPATLMIFAQWYPKVRFNFSHCRLMGETAAVIERCPNVWADTACLSQEDFKRIGNYDWKGRLMFGTDIPACQAHADVSLTQFYRECLKWYTLTGCDGQKAFSSFLRGKDGSRHE